MFCGGEMDMFLLLSQSHSCHSSRSSPCPLLTFIIIIFLDMVTSDVLLCHSACHCLDTFFDCTARNLKLFPSDFPIWINKLNVSNNEIGSVEPGDLSRLVHLESLFLDGNNLTNIPGGADRLDSLVQLTLSRNSIGRIDPTALSSFRDLREIDLSKNKIMTIHNSSFPRDNHIQALNLGSNFLESLESGSFDPLLKMSELNLAKNRIKSITKDAFLHTRNLERLDLSRNKLEVMESLRFQELKKLLSLNLRRNEIGNLSDAAFYGLEKIQHLYLDWNNIRVVEKRWLYGLRSLRILNLSHNELSRIEDESWEFMEQVQILDLSYNQIEEISKKTLSGLSKLRTMDLSNNRIMSIQEDAFLSLDKLEVLDLSQNSLSWVLEDVYAPFHGLKECHTLNLGSNQIHSLHPEALEGLGNLRSLNLSANPITWLSEKAFLRLPTVSLLLADVASLVCDCESQWLLSKLLVQQNTRLRHEGIRGKKQGTKPYCAFPLELANRNLLDLTLQELSCSEMYRRPVFLEEPKTQVFLVEGNGTMTCHLRSPPNIPVSVTWRKDHEGLPKELENQIERSDRVGSDGGIEVISKLHLVNVSWSDSGRYQCIGQGLGVVFSKKANVTVHIFPTFVKKPSNVTVRLGSNAKLECGAKGYPPPEIAFQKDGGEDFPAALERRFHVMPNDDSFFIMEVKVADMGIYSCSARNAAGEIRTFATVTVFETPSFRYVMEDESAIEGSNAILECLANGSPKPQTTWRRHGVQITEGLEKRFHLTENGSLLLIKDVQSEDSGNYECLLTNAVGTAKGISVLTVVSGSGESWSLDNTTMTIIFIIIAVFCVVVTSAAWVAVIYTTRKRKKQGIKAPEAMPLRHKYDEYVPTASNYPTLAPFQMSKVVCGDSGSESSSGKDSGNGEELQESILATDGEDETSGRGWQKKGIGIESFSTFGGARVSSISRLPETRLDLIQKSECDKNLISLRHTGKEFQSIPRRVPIPVPPSHHPHVHVHVVDMSPSPTTMSQSDKNPTDGEEEEKNFDEMTRRDPLPSHNVITSISTPV